MALNVTHTYVSSVADSSSAQAAGKVLPQSHWNAPHTVSGTMLAIDVENIPAGGVTATDVQAAINQLYSLIPSPGPGTDPLALAVGLSVRGYNQTIYPGDDGFTEVAEFRVAADGSRVQPSFSNIGNVGIIMTATNGQATYGPTTQCKISFMPLQVAANYNASGQKFLFANSLTGYGMSDTCMWADNLVVFGGGPVNGDEGQGWGSVSALLQQGFIQSTTISAVATPAVINTTTTQAVVASRNAQTVTVADASSLVDGTWIVIEQALESNSLNTEAVQVISHTATSITGMFRCNHANGTTVTPALVLTCPSTFQMGQDRFLVNLSQPSYSTGQVTAFSGGGVDFSGTALAANIVGGNVKNIGCIAFECDDYAGSPFSAPAPLKDWYQILQVTTATHLAVNSFSVAGDASYKGNGTDVANLPTNYIIRPSARVLRIVDSSGTVTGQIICESSSSTWTVGDSVSQAVCPYPDVTGFQWSLGSYSAGGSYRAFQTVKNVGARTFDAVWNVESWGTIIEPGADNLSWGTILAANATHNIGISLIGTRQVALKLVDATQSGQVDLGGMIKWGVANIRMHSGNGGMYINPENGVDGVTPINSGVYTNLLQFFGPLLGSNTNNLTMQMNWGGSVYLPVVQNRTSSIAIEDDQGGQDGVTNYSRFGCRWAAHVLNLGTEAAGTGAANPVALIAGSVEIMRLLTTGNIKYTNAANFSANGGVATAVTGVGPAGASTTVQKWLTIQDDGGVTRYIPCF